MQVVYIVVSVDYSGGSTIQGVYTTYDLAHARIEQVDRHTPYAHVYCVQQQVKERLGD